jgi:hypothetical protein
MPNRNELVADHCLKVAGVAAAYIVSTARLGAQDIVGIEIPPGRISFCCNAGDKAILARLAKDCGGDLDLAVLNVKHRVRDIALRKHILVLVKFQYRLTGSNFGEKHFRIKRVLALLFHEILLSQLYHAGRLSRKSYFDRRVYSPRDLKDN